MAGFANIGAVASADEAGRCWVSQFRTYGGTASNNCYPQGTRGNYARTGMMRNITAGEGITNELVGLPSGYRHPGAWMMPQKPGALSARNTIYGDGSASATAQSGYNISADVTGSGGITASAGLIITLAASIAGSGGVTSGVTKALATMVASLAGSGNITAAAAGLAAMTANLTGAGSVNANNTALADITASIVGYGEATSQGIRDAVWSAIASEFNAAGSMGAKLNTASSGGVDIDAMADAVWASASRTLTSVGVGITDDIAAAVRSALSVELARIDAAVTTRQAAGTVNANVTSVNGIAIDGAGTELNPWGPV